MTTSTTRRISGTRSEAGDSRRARVWTEYGAFSSRRGKWGKAEEAFKEALVLDERHVPALRALAALMLRDEEHHRAEVYAQGITASAPPAIPSRGVSSSATYARMDRETDAVNCEFEARRLAAGVINNLLGSPGATATRADPNAPEAHVQAASGARLAPPRGVRAARPRSLGRGRRRGPFVVSRARGASRGRDGGGVRAPHGCHVRGRHGVASELPDFTENPLAEPEEAYAHAMASHGRRGSPAGVTQTVPASRRRALGGGETRRRAGCVPRGVRVLVPARRRCRGAAVALLRGGDLEGAEAALAEANILDASNPKVWGYLCVVALLAERVDEAEAALGSAFKTDLRDARLLAEVGDALPRARGDGDTRRARCDAR